MVYSTIFLSGFLRKKCLKWLMRYIKYGMLCAEWKDSLRLLHSSCLKKKEQRIETCKNLLEMSSLNGDEGDEIHPGNPWIKSIEK